MMALMQLVVMKSFVISIVAGLILEKIFMLFVICSTAYQLEHRYKVE